MNSRCMRAALVVACFFCNSANELRAQSLEPLQSLNEKLAKLISPSASAGEIQISTLPAVVQWNTDGGRYAFYQMCDSLSSWSPEIKSTGVLLSDRYIQYLLGIQARVGDPAADLKQREYAAKAREAQKAFNKERLNVLKEWDELVVAESRLPEASKTAYSTFMQYQGAELASLQVSALLAYSQWHPYVAAAIPSSVGFSLNEMLNPATKVKVKTFSGAELNVFECSPNINLEAELANAKALVADSSRKPDQVIEVGRRTGDIRQSWQTWGASGGWGPFSVRANGSRSEISVVTTNFKLTYEIPVLIRFELVRPWLKFAIIQTYKDSAIVANTELDALKPLFGEKGSFALVPLEFVVAYQPRVMVKMDSSDFKSARSSYEGGGGFSVGPFSARAGTAGGSFVQKWDEATSTVTIGTSAGSFVLLGVRNRVLP